MILPDDFQKRTFVEWNYLLKGLVAAWEVAHLLGLDNYLDRRLQEEDGQHLAERLGALGNGFLALFKSN